MRRTSKRSWGTSWNPLAGKPVRRRQHQCPGCVVAGGNAPRTTLSLQAQNTLLTFTSIGKDVFPAATETMLNMSTAMARTQSSGLIQLGKALNDPIRGIGSLSRVGAHHCRSKRADQGNGRIGHLMGAQKVILRRATTEFRRRGKQPPAPPSPGKMSILNNVITRRERRALGLALIPVLLTWQRNMAPT